MHMYYLLIISDTKACTKYCCNTKEGALINSCQGIPEKCHKEGDI